MARLARLKFEDSGGWYHLYASVAARKGEYPLGDPVIRHKLLSLIKFYAHAYCLDVAAFALMGNHYHLVVRFEAPRKLSREELFARALRFYPRSRKRLECWPAEKWARFAKRIFDVSEFMRSVQGAFAVWYNRTSRRKGQLWADRFKSTLLLSAAAALDAVLYVELNGVRAGLAERPEDFAGCSLYLREAGKAEWLMPISEIFPESAVGDGGGGGSGGRGYEAFKGLIYHRGAVQTRAGQKAIAAETLKAEEARGFRRRGVFRRKLRCFTDGLALGGEAAVREKLAELRALGEYLRRRNPVTQAGELYCLREQRGNFVQT